MRTVCPVCREELTLSGHSYKCSHSHCFDIAKEGYVNLLRSNRAGENIGDNRSMALCRREVLSKGYYSSLSGTLCELIPNYKAGGELLDVCCGEGYYAACMAQALPSFGITGFDISKEMVRLAAKRKSRAEFFVANMTGIPVADKSFDVVTHLFAPFCSEEFSRVLKDDGVLFSIVSGENHLLELKNILYDTPYRNDEAQPEAKDFRLIEKVKISDKITLTSGEDIMSLLRMTPYYYHTPTEGLNRLSALSSLTTSVEFVIFVYRKG